jgi:eukaryotic-like serine/threonine-protein kinase
MNVTRACPQCGGPLPADAPPGRCPRCSPDPASAASPATATVPDTAAASPSSAGRTGEVRLNSATEQPGDVIGRYKLIEKIGEGGCGVVYLAEQSEPVRRKVALKVIKLGMDTKAVMARFDAERQVLAMMDHPNIAQVFDAGATATGRPYFVMELVQGTRITNYCDGHRLDTAARLDLFTTVCAAIQHAHQKGIIHRDIKPSNILVAVHEGVPVPKVIDFGIAKATEAQLNEQTLLTEYGDLVGTPAYMSPEQAEMSGTDMDTRADIYSLGVLLYELLSGRLPFDPETLMESGLMAMRRTICEVEPPRPSMRLTRLKRNDLLAIAQQRNAEVAELSTQLRGDLDWIVMKALEKDRTRRYESASAFAEDIKRHRQHEPVLACPPDTLYLLQKFVRRHRIGFAAGTAVAASLVIGLGVSLWMFFKEQDARERAVTAEQAESKLRKVADTQRDKAVAERDRADEETRRARRLLYIAHMNLAKRAWDEGGVGCWTATVPRRASRTCAASSGITSTASVAGTRPRSRATPARR